MHQAILADGCVYMLLEEFGYCSYEQCVKHNSAYKSSSDHKSILHRLTFETAPHVVVSRTANEWLADDLLQEMNGLHSSYAQTGTIAKLQHLKKSFMDSNFSFSLECVWRSCNFLFLQWSL